MGNDKHTPAPWVAIGAERIEAILNTNGKTKVLARLNKPISKRGTIRGENEIQETIANARLI